MKENQRIVITKRMLKEALLRLLEKKKLDKIHVNELCKEAGINRATFYRHYETTRDVLAELEMEFIKNSMPHTKHPQNADEARKMLEFTCAYFYDNADIAKVLFKSNSEEDLMSGINKFYSCFMEIQKSFVDKDEDTAKIIVSFMGAVDTACCVSGFWKIFPRVRKKLQTYCIT